jgi:hypothetical protein
MLGMKFWLPGKIAGHLQDQSLRNESRPQDYFEMAAKLITSLSKVIKEARNGISSLEWRHKSFHKGMAAKPMTSLNEGKCFLSLGGTRALNLSDAATLRRSAAIKVL